MKNLSNEDTNHNDYTKGLGHTYVTMYCLDVPFGRVISNMNMCTCIYKSVKQVQVTTTLVLILKAFQSKVIIS